MAFESVGIISTRNGVSPITGYRQDLVAGDVIGLALSSMVGVSSVRWRLIGRPEYSSAGGAGPEPILLATAPTSSFTVDADVGSVGLDGTYDIEATINPGSPGEVRKTTILCRLSALTIPGIGGARQLRKISGCESVEDTSVPSILQGWATQINRWLELVRTIATGGGVIETLSGAYAVGLAAADQTLALDDSHGGGIIINAAGGGFTGASALRINTAAGGPVVVARASANLGIGTAAPALNIHVLAAAPALRLERSGGAALDIKNVTDTLVFANGGTTLASMPSTGGVRADLGVGIGAAPSTSATLAMGAGSAAAVSAANTMRLRYNEISQLAEISQNGVAYVPLVSAGASPGTVITGAPAGTTNLGGLGNGNLQQTVTAGVATVVVTPFTTGAIPFGAANSTLTQDAANLVWDNTNKFLGVGTNAPTTQIDVVTSAASISTQIRVINTSTSTSPVAAQVGATNGSQAIRLGTMGLNSAAFTAGTPNLIAGMTFLLSLFTAGLYIGSPNTISLQTGATQAERLKIDTTGNVSVSSLGAGGLVKAANPTGQLSIAIPGVDYAVTAGAFTQGSVPFANVSGALTQDNANLFWDATNKILSVGSNTPPVPGGSQYAIYVNKSLNNGVVVGVENPSTAVGAEAIFNLKVDSGSGSFLYTGANFVGSGSVPNLQPHSVGLFTTTVNSVSTFIGSHGFITLQTGNPTFAERMKILATGEVQLTSLAAGGMVKAAAGGQLGIGVSGTDFLAPPVSMTAGSVLFAGAAGAVAQDNANFFWDDANNRLGIGTNAPIYPMEVVIGSSATGRSGYRAATASTATDAAVQYWATNGNRGLIAGITGLSYVAIGATPNLVANTAFVSTTGAVGGSLYLGADSVITMQTGATQAERLKIDAAGNVSLSSLNAGGIAKAAATTGQLSIAVSGTDYLAPATALTTGSVLFAGVAGAVAQDNANLFWDDTNNRLGIGTNTPGQVLHVLQTGNFNTISELQNIGTGALSQAQFSAHNGTAAAALGITGASFVAGGLEPNLGAATAYLRTSGAANTLYLGSFGVITMQTGGTQAERLKIDLSGNVSISSLAAGGVVVADPTTGKLGISGGGGGSTLGMVTTGGSSAFSLGTLASGVLEHVVTSSVSAPTSIVMVAGQIPFGSGTNGLLAQDANLFFDNTNKRLAIGTNAPLNDLNIVRNSNGAVGAVLTNPGTGTSSTAFFNAQSGTYGSATASVSMGMTGTNYVGTGIVPNLGSNTAVITTVTAGPTPTIYIGSHGVITLQTGPIAQAERLRILATGEVRLSSLAGGGLVRAAAGTGQLGIGLVTTPDITDQNVTLTKLEPIGPSKVLGFDGGTGPTGSPFDMTVIAPLRVPTGQGQLVFDTQFTQGSVVFQGATQIAQDPSAFFWNATNHRLGIGTNVPIFDLDVRNDSDVITTTMVRNQGAGTHALAQFVATNSAGGGIGIAMGVAGSGFTATTNRPLVVAGMPYVVPYFGSQNLYVGAPGTLIFATGNPTETNRLQILGTGQINLSSLSAGGMVTAAPSTGQLGVVTFAAGEIPFGAASGGSLSQDSHLVWDNTNKRLGLGANIGSPAFDLHVVASVNTTTVVAVENGNAGTLATAEFIASNGSPTAILGATGAGYVAVAGSTPNLGASTPFLRAQGGAPLYIGAVTDITFQAGNPQAEVMRLLSTGETVVRGKLSGGTAPATELVLQGTTHATLRGHVACLDPFGVGRSAGVLGGAPMFAVAGNVSVNSSAGASLDWAVFNTSTVTITGGTNITNANGFNWFTVQPPVYSTTVIVGAGSTTPAAATLSVPGAPTITGGGSFAGLVGPVGLWVKGGTQLEGTVRIHAGDLVLDTGSLDLGNGNITVGGTALFAGSNTTIFGAFQTQGQLGLFGQTPQNKQVITGSRAAMGAAGASMLAAGVTYGLWIDSTSP